MAGCTRSVCEIAAPAGLPRMPGADWTELDGRRVRVRVRVSWKRDYLPTGPLIPTRLSSSRPVLARLDPKQQTARPRRATRTAVPSRPATSGCAPTLRGGGVCVCLCLTRRCVRGGVCVGVFDSTPSLQRRRWALALHMLASLQSSLTGMAPNSPPTKTNGTGSHTCCHGRIIA